VNGGVCSADRYGEGPRLRPRRVVTILEHPVALGPASQEGPLTGASSCGVAVALMFSLLGVGQRTRQHHAAVVMASVAAYPTCNESRPCLGNALVGPRSFQAVDEDSLNFSSFCSGHCFQQAGFDA